MNASRHVMAVIAIGTLLPFPAYAQSAPVFTPASSWSVGTTELSNVRGLTGVKMPCVITTEFDNGFVVRFSGGGGKILAMAVDFRQAVFNKGKKYDAAISVGDGYVKQVSASAFTDSTLIFNLRNLNDFYKVLKSGKTLAIDIDDNSLKFNLGQIGGSFSAFESCYATGNAAPVKPMPGAPSGNPVPAVETTPAQATVSPIAMPEGVENKQLPQSLDQIVQGSDIDTERASQPATQPAAKGKMNVAQVTPKPAQPVRQPDPVTPPQKISRANPDDMTSTPRPQPQEITPPQPQDITPMPISPRPENAPSRTDAKPVAQPQQTATPQPQPPVAPVSTPAAMPTVWEARAGEDIKIVLSRWAERAGYDLQWQASQEGKVAQDIKLNGTFEDAVTQLLAETGAATGGIAGHIETEQGATRPLPKKDVAEPPIQGAPVQATIPAMQSEWTAPQGANIQTVVEDWASKAGVTVVWQDYMSFPVKGAVNVNGGFEKAVEALLDQYSGDQLRPLGQLNIDPATGQRTLLMTLDK